MNNLIIGMLYNEHNPFLKDLEHVYELNIAYNNSIKVKTNNHIITD